MPWLKRKEGQAESNASMHVSEAYPQPGRRWPLGARRLHLLRLRECAAGGPNPSSTPAAEEGTRNSRSRAGPWRAGLEQAGTESDDLACRGEWGCVCPLAVLK
jgi:hypothetical protein